jgi:hypothetical protein
MVLKNKNKTIALKFTNWIKDEGCGKQFFLIPSIGVYWNDTAKVFILQLWIGEIQLWFGDVKDLI